MTDSKALVDKLWNYCNVLRDDGLSYGDYVESGDLVPGLVADPDVCGGALRIDGTRTDAEWVAGAITERLGWENWSEDRAVLTIAAECSIDPELVRVAAQVGGAL